MVRSFDLVRIDGKTERILSTFRAKASGKFAVTNVPHGRYRVQVSPAVGGMEVRSLPFDIGEGGSEAVVRWFPP